MTITLSLPPKELSPNARPHHMAKAHKVRHYRADACLAGLAVIGAQPKPRLKTATVRVQWFTKTITRPDGDNALASLKAAFDGLSDAGVFADDRGNTYPPVQFAKDAKNPRIEITIERLSE